MEPLNKKEFTMQEQKKNIKKSILEKRAEIKKIEFEITRLYADYFDIDQEITIESEVVYYVDILLFR